MEHFGDLNEHNISPVDLVVSNLYPFDETVKKVGDSEIENDEVIENIDIGGQALLRAAAKNYKDVLMAPHRLVGLGVATPKPIVPRCATLLRVES